LGVPVNAPVPLLSSTLVGSVPAKSDHVSAPVPPLVAIEWPVYESPSVQSGSVAVVMARVGLMTSWSALESEPAAASTTVAAKLKVPLTLEVPLTTPAALKLKPVGSAPPVSDQV